MRVLWVMLLAVALPLSGCGFKLRGTADLPPYLQSLYVVGPAAIVTPRERFHARLLEVLQRNGVTVTQTAEEASAVLAITSVQRNDRLLALGSRTGVREEEISTTVTITVRLTDGDTVLPPETFSTRRNLLYDEAKVLGREASERLLEDDMVEDLVNTVMRRLQALPDA